MAGLVNADDSVYSMMRDLVANHHPNLALCDTQIAIVFKEKAGKSGDHVIAGKTSKASELFGVLGDNEWKFVITLASDVWVDLTDREKVALIDHHLCGCKVEENQSSGALTYKVVLPEIAFYREEIERHGYWRTKGAPPSKHLLHDIFGIDSDSDSGEDE